MFSPAQEEIDKAFRTVAAYREAQAQGLGAIQVDGQMVDVATVASRSARHRPSRVIWHAAILRSLAIMMKSSSGNFFEDFRLGQEFVHAVPRDDNDR